MTSRNQRAAIGQETVIICEQGEYRLPSNRFVSISESLQHSLDATRLISEDQWEAILTSSMEKAATRSPRRTRITVRNVTTLAGAKSLAGNGRRVLALNFASAKNPGGGFLGGSQAQEESIARASGLYPTLLKCPTYYELHKRNGSCLYSHTMILSPEVVVFRDDNDTLIESPWTCSFLTSAAVNAGCLQTNEPSKLSRVESVMRDRIRRVLALAVVEGYTHLVLGAWGCGVFRNDPEMIAGLFAEALKESFEFKGAFEEVLFAVLDRTGRGEVITPFEKALGCV